MCVGLWHHKVQCMHVKFYERVWCCWKLESRIDILLDEFCEYWWVLLHWLMIPCLRNSSRSDFRLELLMRSRGYFAPLLKISETDFQWGILWRKGSRISIVLNLDQSEIWLFGFAVIVLVMSKLWFCRIAALWIASLFEISNLKCVQDGGGGELWMI